MAANHPATAAWAAATGAEEIAAVQINFLRREMMSTGENEGNKIGAF